VANLTTRHIDLAYSRWRAEGMTAATVLHHHRVLRAALSQAERWGWIARNPAKFASVASSRTPELHVPTPQQAQALVLRAASTASPDLGPILLFAMLTGCRRGEICGLEWSEIDWATQRLIVRRSVWQVRRSLGVKDTKTHQVRRIALDENATALLRARRVGADADAAAAGITLAREASVWSPAVDGSTPRTPDSLTRAFARLCWLLEAEATARGRREQYPFRLHDLRHFSATELIGAGVDIRTVAGRSGHADPAITLRVCAHALEERDRAAAELLGRRLQLPQTTAVEE
jgi:integrase